MNSISIALIDGHPVTIEGLRHVLAAHGTFTIVACGESSRDAIAIAEQHRPALMILDLAIPGNAVAAISDIRARYPGLGIIVFTAAPGVDYAVNAMEAGARGYVSKSCTPEEIVSAVRTVVAGDTYVSQNFANEVITALRNASVRRIAMQALRLSVREEQIVQFLLGGKTNREIASQLGITERTVKHYMTVLMQKLNARNRVEVVIAAQDLRRGPAGQPNVEAHGLKNGPPFPLGHRPYHS
ncbi:response regulator [Microvirga guangxiensis]|uniref:Two component transcriptional regulator, LuxR family n=1 Tax=Microvirga guangxiensis TaxID=549386 RepID=A0A1G5LL15_9HYPH|nr:response regulator transcription factor [Microvirga guangxiensis]SCZ13506.1 two component transcriptional regulator, LuxR family [Microvirga guangxiensis]